VTKRKNASRSRNGTVVKRTTITRLLFDTDGCIAALKKFSFLSPFEGRRICDVNGQGVPCFCRGSGKSSVVNCAVRG